MFLGLSTYSDFLALSLLLFPERCVPPSYSIWDVSTLSLLFTFYPTNFVRDRDLVPSQSERVNETASADLVPSQINFAQVEKHLKRKLESRTRKGN